ncbi:unnamed protein product [Calicophoron daubneyi]|uniref:Secreted protein n=1 Tax=Calicophoron daubneyi TaxID=300641 RepID=A0AAV2T0A0_CALDB
MHFSHSTRLVCQPVFSHLFIFSFSPSVCPHTQFASLRLLFLHPLASILSAQLKNSRFQRFFELLLFYRSWFIFHVSQSYDRYSYRPFLVVHFALTTVHSLFTNNDGHTR